MVTYLSKPALSHPNDSGVFVVDVDMQCSLLTPEQMEFMSAFPKIYRLYKKICLNHYKNRAGTAMIFQEGGYRVALLFTKMSRNDTPETILVNFRKCLRDLFMLVPSDVYLYSPILGRRDKCFPAMITLLRSELKNNNEAARVWHICRGENKNVND